MTRQKNPKLYPAIQKEGCYMLSGMKKVQLITGTKFDFDNPDFVNKTYDELLKKNIINARCLMQSPTQFFSYFGLDIRQRVKADGVAFEATYTPFENEFEILCFKTSPLFGNYTHFVLGNGKSGVEFDPMGDSDAKPLGYVCTKGKLNSKRIFSIVKKDTKKTKEPKE